MENQNSEQHREKFFKFAYATADNVSRIAETVGASDRQCQAATSKLFKHSGGDHTKITDNDIRTALQEVMDGWRV